MEPITDQKIKFVSRGGLKLEHALEFFGVKVAGLTVLDVGSSTGGFVDCLLQSGAKKVYSVDTAYGELAWKLRQDPRVVVMERTNILHLSELRGEEVSPPTTQADHRAAGGGLTSGLSADCGLGSARGETLVDLITIDASWTKLELILPVVKSFLKPGGKIIALLKPHYQAEKKDLVKGVLKEEKIKEIVDSVIKNIKSDGWEVINRTDSPILGGGGNREFLLLLI